DMNSILSKVRQKVIAKLSFGSTKKRKIGDLLLWESDRGRKFPIKAWDNEYFKVLANSEFVLCPSGDYVWSYRFFEAALCGAIPIVEESCNAYNGFRFLTFNDEISDLKWSKVDSEHNFKTCVESITVPSSVLNEEIANIIRLNG
ncbi:MAG: exostosin family protein, partial [Pseudomonadales bacterium]